MAEPIRYDERTISGFVDEIGGTIVLVRKLRGGLRDWFDLSHVAEVDKPKLKRGAPVEIHRYRERSPNGSVRRIEEVVFP